MLSIVNSFGLVGLIAISPLIAIQILGIIFRVKEHKAKGELSHNEKNVEVKNATSEE